MIKRILVALDPDKDTKAATHYAVHLAKRFDAGLAGMAVIDVSNMYANIGAGGYGPEYYTVQMRKNLEDGTRKMAAQLLESFRADTEKAGVEHVEIQKEGNSPDVIIEEMKYHDLLIIGRDSRFFYNEPDRDTKTLAKVVKNGTSSTLMVTETYREIGKVMVACDGSAASVRSLKDFVHLLPYGKDIKMDLVSVLEDSSNDQKNAFSYSLDRVAEYLKAHNFDQVEKTLLEGKRPWEQLLARQKMNAPDLVILGAHAVSAIRRATFGSTTHEMIVGTEGPLFLSR